MYKIPLTNSPNQTFQCTVPVNQVNINFNFNLWYNEQAEYWLLTLSNYTTGEVYFANLPLVSSKGNFGNMIHQLSYKNIGMCFMLPTTEDLKCAANNDNLGQTYIMIWGDNE